MAQPGPPALTAARALFAPLGLAVTSAAAVAVISTVDPNQPGHYPGCPFRLVTGLACPGCGTLRAVYDLAHGEPVDALHRNPLTVLAMPVLVILWLSWTRRRVSGRPLVNRTVPGWVLWAVIALVIGFGVLRNLPGWAWLGPGS